MEILELLIDEEGNERIDSFLSNELQEYSRSYIQKLIKDGLVKVNNKIVKPKYNINQGDKIIIQLPKPRKISVTPENIPVEIIYEDDDLAIVNKPQGMVVHPAPGNYSGTLVNALLHHCNDLSSINGVIRPGIVHRIDKDTSGLLMIAKNNKSHNFLSEQLKEHSIKRIYYAIVYGIISEESGTINAPIGRHPINRLKMAVVEKNSKNAITHFKVIDRFEKYTLVQLQLETGRTHQIRVHMSYIGYPLLGDPVYGVKREKIKLNGQALHAKVLGFIHPSTYEYMEFDSQLPKYFQEALRKVKKISK